MSIHGIALASSNEMVSLPIVEYYLLYLCGARQSKTLSACKHENPDTMASRWCGHYHPASWSSRLVFLWRLWVVPLVLQRATAT